jgi:hypothetical protein
VLKLNQKVKSVEAQPKSKKSEAQPKKIKKLQRGIRV